MLYLEGQGSQVVQLETTTQDFLRAVKAVMAIGGGNAPLVTREVAGPSGALTSALQLRLGKCQPLSAGLPKEAEQAISTARVLAEQVQRLLGGSVSSLAEHSLKTQGALDRFRTAIYQLDQRGGAG